MAADSAAGAKADFASTRRAVLARKSYKTRAFPQRATAGPPYILLPNWGIKPKPSAAGFGSERSPDAVNKKPHPEWVGRSVWTNPPAEGSGRKERVKYRQSPEELRRQAVKGNRQGSLLHSIQTSFKLLGGSKNDSGRGFLGPGYGCRTSRPDSRVKSAPVRGWGSSSRLAQSCCPTRPRDADRDRDAAVPYWGSPRIGKPR